MLGNISSLCVFIHSPFCLDGKAESGIRGLAALRRKPAALFTSACGVGFPSPHADVSGVEAGLYVIFCGVYESGSQCISDCLMHVVHAKFAEDVFAVCIDGVEA